MRKRLIAAVLCVLMLIPVISACTESNNPAQTTENTQNTETSSVSGNETTGAVADTINPDDIIYVDKDGYEIDSIPKVTYGNKVVEIIAWSDYTMLEFEPESATLNADPINDAILKRNNKVEERLDIELHYNYTPGNTDNMSAFIQKIEADSLDHQYMIIASYSRTAPSLALRGYSTDLNELDNINFDKPWWPDSLVNEVSINDKLYFCSGDISTNMLWMMEATFFNKSLIEKYHLENPYELVRSGNWTFNKLFEMCEGKYEDATSNGKTADDSYGMTLYTVNIDAFQTSAGIKSVVNNDGQLELAKDFSEQKIIDLIDDFIDFFKSGNIYYADTTKATRDVFFEERSIFMTDRVFVIAGKDNSSDDRKINFEYGLVPNPKYSASQDEYYTNLGHPFTIYTVPGYITDADQQIAGTVLECLASEAYRIVTPQVFEVVMKVKYAYGDEASEMMDTIRNAILFEPGRLFNIASYFTSSHFNKTVMSLSNSWKSDYKKIEAAINSSIDNINTTLS